MRNLALVMLGRSAEAIEDLAAVTLSPTHRLTYFVEGLKHTIAENHDRAAEELRRLVDIPDPEARFYVARNLAHVGQRDEALSLLGGAVDGGFFCLPALTRDPWLDSLRPLHEFAAILRRAETRHRNALISFLNAEGDRILGVAHPV
jgi:hypothetical protein